MHEKRLADRFSIDDRNDIDIIMTQFKRDARGQISYQKVHAIQLLQYYRKHIDADVPDNIFGCGGCANKIINQMFKIQKEWQNQIT